MNYIFKQSAFFVIILILIFSEITFAESIRGKKKNKDLERIDYIQKSLDKSSLHAKYWRYGWLSIFSIAGLRDSVSYVTTNSAEKRYNAIVDFIITSSGFTKMALYPISAVYAAEKLRSLPDDTIALQKAKLKEAEKSLQTISSREEKGISLKTHILGGIAALLGGIAIAMDKRPKEGALYFGTLMLSSELKIFTMPKRAISDWKEYKRKYKNVIISDSFKNINNRTIYANFSPGGFVLGVRF